MSTPDPLSAERLAGLRRRADNAEHLGVGADVSPRTLRALLDQADEAARLAGENRRLQAAIGAAIKRLGRIASGPWDPPNEPWSAAEALIGLSDINRALTPPEPSGGEG